MKKSKKVKGFTLIELVVTIGIIAVMSAILVSAVSAFLEDARNVADAADAKNIYTLFQVKVLTGDNFMIDSSSPHTNKWNQSSNPGSRICFCWTEQHKSFIHGSRKCACRSGGMLMLAVSENIKQVV